MDNKKLYKRISTCFWFLLATLPFWYVTITSLFLVFVHTDSVSFTISDLESYKNSFTDSWYSNFNSFNSVHLIKFIPTIILNPFRNLLLNVFNILGYQLLAIPLAWFVWVYIIELMIDFVAWLPKLIHSFMERWLVD